MPGSLIYLRKSVRGLMCYEKEGVQRRHDPRKNDLRTSGFAELPPGPAKLVSQPQ